MRIPETRPALRHSVQVPGPRLAGMQVSSNAAMFGATDGQNLEQAGRLIQSGAARLAALADDLDTTAAREAASQMQADALVWQEQMRQKSGKEALRAGEEFAVWSREQIATRTRDLSPAQRERFDRLVADRLAVQQVWAQDFGRAQEHVYKQTTWENELRIEGASLTADITEPALARLSLERIKDATFLLARDAGLSASDATRLMGENTHAALSAAIAARIDNGETDLAATLLKNYAPDLDPASRHHLETQLRQYESRER